MKLYHYTGLHHIAGIQHHGIIVGKYRTGFGRGWDHGTWLTSDGDWSKQVWMTTELQDCDRTEARCVVVIPKTGLRHLAYWDALAASYDQEWVQYFNLPGHEHWYVYTERIPPSWVRKWEYRATNTPTGRGLPF